VIIGSSTGHQIGAPPRRSARPSDEHHRQSSGATSKRNAKSKAVLMDSRDRRRTGGWLLAVGAIFVSTVLGCTASSDEVRPPRGQFFFPTGLALDPAQSSLFVVNANSELRYDSGTVNVINLRDVDSYVSGWTSSARTIPPGCKQDPTQPETLVCDEAQLIRGEAGVRIGNFATGLSVQDTESGTARLIVPVRGDPSISWIDWNGTSLSCDNGAQSFALCDDAHRLTTIRNDEALGLLPEEPFRTFVDSGGEYAVVTHLNSGVVTLVNSRIGQAPIIADVVGGLFLPDSLSGTPGGTAVAGRNPGSGVDLLYVASRSENRIQMLTVEGAKTDSPALVQSNFFFLSAAGGNNGGSSDSRGLAFTADGNRMLVINRSPPTLQIYDTSLDEAGFPKNQAVAVYDICRDASGLTVGDVGDGELALVTCFREGTVFIIDATGRRQTDAVVSVGRGPFDIVISPTHEKAYVTNFLEDTVGVIDLDPESATRFREVLRIGETRL
jgi:DNA-binding beta-propeller fold protein YncE